MEEKDFILGFSNSIGVGPKSLLKLLKIYGTALEAWNKSSQEKYKEAGVGEKNYAKFEEFKKTFSIEEYKKKLKKAKRPHVNLNPEMATLTELCDGRKVRRKSPW